MPADADSQTQTQTQTHQTQVEIVEIFSQEGANKFLQMPGAVKNLFISTKNEGLTHSGKPTRRFEKRSARGGLLLLAAKVKKSKQKLQVARRAAFIIIEIHSLCLGIWFPRAV